MPLIGKLAGGVPEAEALSVALATPAVLGLNTIERVQEFPAASGRLLQESAVTIN